MKAELSYLQRALACLAHASRFRILIELMERPRFVSELAVAVRLSQSCTTRHLQAMSRAGLVRGARDGRRVFFEVERATPVLAALAPWTELAGGKADKALQDPGAGRPAADRTAEPRSDAGPRPKSRSVAAPRRAPSPQVRKMVEAGLGREEAPAAQLPPAATRRASQDLEDFLL